MTSITILYKNADFSRFIYFSKCSDEEVPWWQDIPNYASVLNEYMIHRQK